MMIECHNVGKKFNNKWALRYVSFILSRGRSLLISGPSGSGKSTLINLMSGILDPTEGEIFVFGHNSRSHHENVKRILSCVWSENSLFKNMSIIDNLRFFSSINGQDWKYVITKATHLMRKLGVYYEQTKFISNLSSGSQRKADLCRSLINDSEIFLLDEPSALLDNKSKKSFIKILLDYKGKGKTLVIVSHHASIYTELVDDIILLKDGKVVHYGPIEKFMNGIAGNNTFILKTSDRFRANEILLHLPEVLDTYVSQKAVHVYLKDGIDLSPVINALSSEGLKLKEVISKKPNLDKLIGDKLNVR